MTKQDQAPRCFAELKLQFLERAASLFPHELTHADLAELRRLRESLRR